MTFHVCEVQDCREAEVAMPMGKVEKTCRFRRVTRCARVVLRGRQGTLGHSTCVRRKTVVRLKLPCLWEKSKMCSCGFAWQAWNFVTFRVCEVRDPREAEVAVPMGKVAKKVSFLTCQKMWSCRFAWQVWHFVTLHT